MTELMKKLQLLTDRYMTQYINAPSKWGKRVFGTQLPTKMDVRRGFLQDLKMIAEVAQLKQDKQVLNYINGFLDEDFSAEVAAIKKIVD